MDTNTFTFVETINRDDNNKMKSITRILYGNSEKLIEETLLREQFANGGSNPVFTKLIDTVGSSVKGSTGFDPYVLLKEVREIIERPIDMVARFDAIDNLLESKGI